MYFGSVAGCRWCSFIVTIFIGAIIEYIRVFNFSVFKEGIDIIFFTEILYLISEKYGFRRRIACCLFLYQFYDKIIIFEEENLERS